MSSNPEPDEPFERTLGRLEAVTAALESPDTGLDEAIALFEQGTELARLCRQRLAAAEQKVERLRASLAEPEADDAEAMDTDNVEDPNGEDALEPESDERRAPSGDQGGSPPPTPTLF